MVQSEYFQVYSRSTKSWIKYSRKNGKIIDYKKTKGKYIGIPCWRKQHEKS